MQNDKGKINLNQQGFAHLTPDYCNQNQIGIHCIIVKNVMLAFYAKSHLMYEIHTIHVITEHVEAILLGSNTATVK